MTSRNIRDRLQRFNLSQPRHPQLLQAKYAAMAAEKENPFVFFRATCHLKISKWDDHLPQSEELMRSLGQVVAWSHLRSSGRQGSAIADQLIDFANKNKWKKEVMEYAKNYSKQVTQDWQEFRSAKRG